MRVYRVIVVYYRIMKSTKSCDFADNPTITVVMQAMRVACINVTFIAH